MLEKFRKLLEIQLEPTESPEAAPRPGPERAKAKAIPDRVRRPALEPSRAERFDKEMEDAFKGGKPRGQPFADSIQQIFLSNRSEEYKATTDRNYRKATAKVKDLFISLERRDWTTAERIQYIVRDFLELLKTDRNILVSLAYLPSSEEDYLYTHSVNVSLLSMAVATGAGYSEEQVREIASAALLIDVGMMRVPEAIQRKSGTLTKEELFEVRKHPITGVDLVSGIDGLSPCTALAIYQHHERISGEGYPKRRSGHLIHDFSRIIAITDSYAAMVANRNYRKRHLPYNAMTSIIKMGGSGQLDQNFIRRFLETMSLFPLGSLVRLESGAIGKIIHSNNADFTKPTLFILKESDSGKVKRDTLLDLKAFPREKIVEALDENAVNQEPMTGF
ncbi:MAG TPA: HD domain-containing phosphohydrolase [Fibrobacteria bacterium]|nr:HD domain-containing phosphohydrolase [Fibrobacteria bacterium]